MPQGQVTIERLCRLARVARRLLPLLADQRAASARHRGARHDPAAGAGQRRYRRGYRYITQQLRREGLIVNHKRVLRLMREDNLLGLRRKRSRSCR